MVAEGDTRPSHEEAERDRQRNRGRESWRNIGRRPGGVKEKFAWRGTLPDGRAAPALHRQIEDAALDRIVEATQGYAYFLQQWGSHTWRAATDSPINAADVDGASVTAIAALVPHDVKVRLAGVKMMRSAPGLRPLRNRSSACMDE